jgi:GT2 family glycosyltransferase
LEAEKFNYDNAPDASVIVVSFNTRDLLRECLSTLRREARGLSYETIVVDNASRDGSADMAAAEFPEMRIIRSKINLGFAAANNLAFKVTRGRYVVLLNSDAFLRPNALRDSIARMDSNPRAGLAGGRLVGRDGSFQPSARMYPSLFNNFLTMSGLAANYPHSRLLGRMDRTWADPLQPAQVDWVPGAYSIIRRSVLDRIGFFDERFFLYYEEVDLCRRIKAAKHEIWYWPDIVVEHIGGESAKTIKDPGAPSSISKTELWRMRSGLLYFGKHHGQIAARASMLLELWWYRLRALRNSWSNSIRRRAGVPNFELAADALKQAWTDTLGGTTSPPRPW